eukprot:sb/3475344/
MGGVLIATRSTLEMGGFEEKFLAPFDQHKVHCWHPIATIRTGVLSQNCSVITLGSLKKRNHVASAESGKRRNISSVEVYYNTITANSIIWWNDSITHNFTSLPCPSHAPPMPLSRPSHAPLRLISYG